MEISSPQNPKIKHFIALQQKSLERRKSGLFVVEGLRELSHCIHAGYRIHSLFVCPSILANKPLPPLPEDIRAYEVTPEVYARMAYREGTEGLMAVVEAKQHSLQDLHLPEKPLVIVLERVEKPGNLGAILRSADAAKADAVIVCDPLTDLYNPNLVRSSIGAVFTVPSVVCTSEECITFLKQRGIRILTAQLQDSRLYYDTDMRSATAIVMGTEGDGLPNETIAEADYVVRIPMSHDVDSLNVAAAAAVAFWELR